jgi:hypothetical protein
VLRIKVWKRKRRASRQIARVSRSRLAGGLDEHAQAEPDKGDADPQRGEHGSLRNFNKVRTISVKFD